MPVVGARVGDAFAGDGKVDRLGLGTDEIDHRVGCCCGEACCRNPCREHVADLAEVGGADAAHGRCGSERIRGHDLDVDELGSAGSRSDRSRPLGGAIGDDCQGPIQSRVILARSDERCTPAGRGDRGRQRHQRGDERQRRQRCD